MKTKKLNKKLTLSKITVAHLGNNEKSAVKGGYWATELHTGCTSWHPVCFTKPVWECNTQLSVCKCIPPTEIC